MTCEICHGDQWVCENHPNLPQCHSDDCGGAGMPCICNPNHECKFDEVIAQVEPESQLSQFQLNMIALAFNDFCFGVVVLVVFVIVYLFLR